MRTLVFGDIHGCLGALDALLSATAPRQDDTVIFLGDYIDRGPYSADVLERLVQLKKQLKPIFLLGNHEQMLLGSRSNPLLHREWIANGGDMTLRSYGNINCTLKDIPAEHWDLLGSLSLYHETGTHIFVHAGVEPLLPMDRQPTHALLWERFADRPPQHLSGKTFICGHTPGRTVRNHGHAICIDTGVFKHNGLLTCLEIGTSRMYQANQKGKVKTDRLPPVIPSGV